MALIFDHFPDLQSAESFLEAVEGEFRLHGWVYTSQEDSAATDVFPFQLTAPIVHIERTLDKREQQIIGSVRRFGGRFAGT